MSDVPASGEFDRLLKDWPFELGRPVVRRARGADGREVLQMRVDMGVLQLEVEGRPDGDRPHGFPTYYDYLMSTAFEEGPNFQLDEARQVQIDREFYQFYHRRVCWLALQEYGRAAADADHTLRLMDFTGANAVDRNWAMMHEQYRPFVTFHYVQASALEALKGDQPQAAVEVVEDGLRKLERLFEEHGVSEKFEGDVFVVKLREMLESIKTQFQLGPTLAQQLADAIASEQYELAAQLRDQMARQRLQG
jgi:hypothetical protein